MAYAHNKVNFIETALMSLIYEGRFYAFPPVTELPEAGVTVIRPMMYVPERGVAHFVADQGIRVVKNTCPVDGFNKKSVCKTVDGADQQGDARGEGQNHACDRERKVPGLATVVMGK